MIFEVLLWRAYTFSCSYLRDLLDLSKDNLQIKESKSQVMLWRAYTFSCSFFIFEEKYIQDYNIMCVVVCKPTAEWRNAPA